MRKEDKHCLESSVVSLALNHSMAMSELAAAGEPAQAGAASVPAAPAVAQEPEKIEEILARCRAE
eukprot:4655513-Alexandrium_andersonii.AAC.1